MRSVTLKSRSTSATATFEPSAVASNWGSVKDVSGDEALLELLQACALRGGNSPMGSFVGAPLAALPEWTSLVAVGGAALRLRLKTDARAKLEVNDGPDPFVLESVPGRIY